jgi:hypothetical protein
MKLKPVKYLNLKDRIALITAIDYRIQYCEVNGKTSDKKYIKYLYSLRKKL